MDHIEEGLINLRHFWVFKILVNFKVKAYFARS